MKTFRSIPFRSLVAVTSLAVTASFFAACGSDESGPDLVVYSGRKEELIVPLMERFEKESGLDVEVRFGPDSAEFALQIDSEGDRGPDVFISQSPGAMGFLDEQGRLVAIDESSIAGVPDEYHAADNHWVGTSARVRVLVYNTDNVTADELPESVFDLTQDAFKGRVGVAPDNSSFIDFVTTLRDLEGDDATGAFLEGLAANGARDYADNHAILEAVARGEVDFGLINHYYNEQALLEVPDQPTANHLFADGDPGSMILMTTVGILKTGEDHRDAAEKLISFMLNEESQTYFATETLEYPLVGGIERGLDGLPALNEIHAPTIDLASLGAKFKTTQKLISDSGLIG